MIVVEELFNSAQFQTFIAITERKRQVSFSMAIMKCGNLARVFSQTFAHENNNEIRQRNRGSE